MQFPGLVLPTGSGSEPVGHSHQVGQGFRIHLVHHLPAVGLYRDFTDTERAANLFVQTANYHERHDLSLPKT